MQLSATAFRSSHCFAPSFLRHAITAHLYQCQQTVVIGRDVDKINLVSSSFIGCYLIFAELTAIVWETVVECHLLNGLETNASYCVVQL